MNAPEALCNDQLVRGLDYRTEQSGAREHNVAQAFLVRLRT